MFGIRCNRHQLLSSTSELWLQKFLIQNGHDRQWILSLSVFGGRKKADREIKQKREREEHVCHCLSLYPHATNSNLEGFEWIWFALQRVPLRHCQHAPGLWRGPVSPVQPQWKMIEISTKHCQMSPELQGFIPSTASLIIPSEVWHECTLFIYLFFKETKARTWLGNCHSALIVS